MIGIAFCLIPERLFLGPLDRVLQQIEHTADAGRLVLFNQPFAAASDQHGLHVGLGLRKIEQLSAIGVLPHFEDTLAGAVADVREGSRGNIQVQIAALFRGLDHAGRHLFQRVQRLAIARSQLDGRCRFTGRSRLFLGRAFLRHDEVFSFRAEDISRGFSWPGRRRPLRRHPEQGLGLGSDD